MAPSLDQIFTLRIVRSKTDQLSFGSTNGSCPRYIAPLTSGYLKTISALPAASTSTSTSTSISSPINAQLVSGCSDWLRHDTATNVGHLDARLQFRDAQSGGLFYVRFEGVIRMDAEIGKLLSWDAGARTTESKEHYSFISPFFEVSQDEHKWMEITAWVGHGHYVVLEPHETDSGEKDVAVEYEIYRLVTG